MMNLVPWTVTYMQRDGKVGVEALYAPSSISSRMATPEVMGLLGLEDGQIISMIRGDHTRTAVVFNLKDRTEV